MAVSYTHLDVYKRQALPHDPASAPQENQFSEERKLDHEVERLYSCTNLKQILAITQENIKEYEEFLERSMSDSRDEVASVKNYIYQHYAEDLSLETLAEKVYLSSGYLSFIFKKETGMNLNRFIRVVCLLYTS